MGNNTLGKREIEEKKDNLENRKIRSFPEESWNAIRRSRKLIRESVHSLGDFFSSYVKVR